MPIVGDILADRYRVDARIGSGGMASVYRGHDLRLDRDVAIKVLLPNMAADAVVAERFEREARALAAAAHPSVVNVYDVEPGDPATGREPFYVMELCDGGSLAERLAKRGRLDPTDVVAIVEAVADGLVDLHGRGIIHRDVKPHNILFAGDRPKLADFGLARSEEPTEMGGLTADGTTVGTLAWLAPELLGGAAASRASDVYALGSVAFQALTGRMPRPAASMAEVVESRTDPAPSVSSVAPELGSAFDVPVAAALSIDPGARPAPQVFADDLRAALPEARPLESAAAAAVVPLAATKLEPADAVDPSADTLAVIRTAPVRPAGSPAGPAGRRRSTTDRRAGPRPAILALGVFALVILALAAMASVFGRPGGAGSSLAPGVSLGASASAPVATPSAPPSVTPAPTPVPAAAALAALDAVDEAIMALDREGGIKNKDLNDLRRRAQEVRAGLEGGNFDRAREAAGKLREIADKLDDDADEDLADRLREAVADLMAAIPGR